MLSCASRATLLGSGQTPINCWNPSESLTLRPTRQASQKRVAQEGFELSSTTAYTARHECTIPRTGQAFLSRLATAIAQSPASEIWCIFDNTASGAATANALKIQTSLALTLKLKL